MLEKIRINVREEINWEMIAAFPSYNQYIRATCHCLDDEEKGFNEGMKILKKLQDKDKDYSEDFEVVHVGRTENMIGILAKDKKGILSEGSKKSGTGLVLIFHTFHCFPDTVDPRK